MFKLPKSYTLGGITYPVILVSEVDNTPSVNGMTFLDKNRIEIRRDLSKDLTGQVFCHELTHSILGIMGENELNNNEKFVDLFGTFLHQALKTMSDRV
jgi:hypothetical protein